MVRSLAVALSVGLAASTRLQVVEKKQHHLRDDWVVQGMALGWEKHAVTIAVKQRNVDLLHDKLMEVSLPDSSKKGEYLSWDEVQALTANPNATAAILSWLDGHGVQVDSVHKHGHYIKATTNVSTWERMLTTSFAHMTRTVAAETSNGAAPPRADSVLRATTDVSLPESIAEIIEGVFMTTQMPPPLRPPPRIKYAGSMEKGFLQLSVEDDQISPAKLKDFYQVTGEGTSSSTNAVFETSYNSYLHLTSTLFSSILICRHRISQEMLESMRVISCAHLIQILAPKRIWMCST